MRILFLSFLFVFFSFFARAAEGPPVVQNPILYEMINIAFQNVKPNSILTSESKDGILQVVATSVTEKVLMLTIQNNRDNTVTSIAAIPGTKDAFSVFFIYPRLLQNYPECYRILKGNTKPILLSLCKSILYFKANLKNEVWLRSNIKVLTK